MNIHIRKIKFASARSSGSPFLFPKLQFFISFFRTFPAEIPNVRPTFRMSGRDSQCPVDIPNGLRFYMNLDEFILFFFDFILCLYDLFGCCMTSYIDIYVISNIVVHVMFFFETGQSSMKLPLPEGVAATTAHSNSRETRQRSRP